MCRIWATKNSKKATMKRLLGTTREQSSLMIRTPSTSPIVSDKKIVFALLIYLNLFFFRGMGLLRSRKLWIGCCRLPAGHRDWSKLRKGLAQTWSELLLAIQCKWFLNESYRESPESHRARCWKCRSKTAFRLHHRGKKRRQLCASARWKRKILNNVWLDERRRIKFRKTKNEVLRPRLSRCSRLN